MISYLLCVLLLLKIMGGAPELENLEQFQIIERCEFKSFRLATQLSDVFNRNNYRVNNEINDGHNGADQSFRLHQDYITEHLGFIPLSMSGYNHTGLTITGSSSSAIRTKGGWVNGTHSSSYQSLHDKYIYFLGDSTVRQVFALFVSIQRGENFTKNAKDWTRTKCRKQYPQRILGSKNHCAKNEVKCDIEGFGPKGRIVYDWKHHIFEDYDKWLWGGTGPWHVDRTIPRPDFLVLQTGMHSCFHEYESRHFNQSNVDNIFKSIPILMNAISNAVNRVEYKNDQFQPPTNVIIMTSGRKFSTADSCILSLNRLIATYARKHGFHVIEREEIERRCSHKSEYVDSSIEIPPLLMDYHLPSPVPEIISTALLKTISCAEQSRRKNTLGSDPLGWDNNNRNMTAIVMALKGVELHGKIIRLKLKNGTETQTGTGVGLETGTGVGMGTGTGGKKDDFQLSLQFPIDIVDIVGFRRTVHDPQCVNVMQLHTIEIVELEEEDFNAIPMGNSLDSHLCKEGSLHRMDQEKVITLIDKGVRKPIPNMDVFTSYNLSIENINVISIGEAELLPLGEPLNI